MVFESSNLVRCNTAGEGLVESSSVVVGMHSRSCPWSDLPTSPRVGPPAPLRAAIPQEGHLASRPKSAQQGGKAYASPTAAVAAHAVRVAQPASVVPVPARPRSKRHDCNVTVTTVVKPLDPHAFALSLLKAVNQEQRLLRPKPPDDSAG